ncbi:MAG: hypothetical protein U9Q69_02550 [Nanoarchaeota archaeon]|nr:hypothetical protein [Nanoarchaeota archaeon]
MNMQYIVLDTNFLVTSYKQKIDIFTNLKNLLEFKYQIYIIDATLFELEKLINEGTIIEKTAVKIGLKLLKRKNIKILKTARNRSVDDLLLALDPRQYIIATQDKELKRKLKKKKFKILTIRQKKHIILE